MMLIAAPTFNKRISPLFDVARYFLMLEMKERGEFVKKEQFISDNEPIAKSRKIVELGVNVLICGAISRQLKAILVSGGVKVVPNRCGSTEKVMSAFVSGHWNESSFLMPGCNDQYREIGHRHRHGGPWRGSEG